MDAKTLERLYYDNSIKTEDLLKQLGIKSRTSLYKLLRQKNIKVKPRGTQLKYIANHSFFSKWSTDMAYCLGFITADGHVWKNRPYLTIAIHKKDIAILEFIRDCISPSSQVRDNTKYNSVQLCIYSKQIWLDLQKYNVTHSKTFSLSIDFNIPKKYWGDYLRGYFDGDGSIYSCNMRGIQYHYASFSCASQQMLIDVQQRLGMGIIRCLRGKYYELRLCKSDCLKLADIMYYNPNHFKLQRKYDKFKEIHINYKFWTPEEDAIILKYIHQRDTKSLTKLLPNRALSSIQVRKNKLQT